MIVLEIDNSYSQIKGLKTTEFRELKKLLSYELDPQAVYFSGGFKRTKSLLDAKGFFPTGLLGRVDRWCISNKIDTQTIDLRVKPKKLERPSQFDLLGIKPYKDQIEAANMACVDIRAGIVMPTGTGKSLVIALIAHKLNVKTLVVVPTLNIKEQLQNTLKAHKLDFVTVLNIDSKELKTAKGFDCLIIDEAHHVAAKTYYDLNKTAWRGIYHRVFCTATWSRNQQNEQMLFEGIAGEVSYRVTYQEAVSRNYIVPIEAYFYDVPKTKVEGYTWSQVYSEIVVNNEKRNEMLAAILLRLQNAGKFTLCLIKEIQHGDILATLTGLPFTNGQYEESSDYIRQFNSGGIAALIGTTGVLAEGVDTKPCEYVIIGGLGKAKSSIMQAVGRGVRRYGDKESCKVILFRDSSHRWSLAHFNAQKKILLDEYGVKVVKLEI